MDAFHRDKNNKDGLTYDCADCRNKAGKTWRDANPEIVRRIIESTKQYRKNYYSRPEIKQRHHIKRIKREFGLSESDYLNLVKTQKNLCAICKQPERTVKNTNLSVDHCHKTKMVRGLLCSQCNRAIGLMNHDTKVLKNAINYLNKK
jgi:hypothetical protein